VPDVRRYFSVFWGILLMLRKLFDNLSYGRAPLVGVLGPILCSKIEASWRELNIIFASSLILLVKSGLPEPPKAPQNSTKWRANVFGSKASNFSKNKYLRTLGTKRPLLKQLLFFSIFRQF